MEKILGHEFTDRITGFKGVAIGHCRYITGCNQTLLQQPCKDDGTVSEGKWFDDQRLTITNKRQLRLDNGNTPGCDIPAPII